MTLDDFIEQLKCATMHDVPVDFVLNDEEDLVFDEIVYVRGRVEIKIRRARESTS